MSDRGFRPAVYTMNPDGARQNKVSRGPAVVFQLPSFSPDGERIVFVSDQDSPPSIYTMRTDGKRQARITDNGVSTDSGPVFSPNVKKLAFLSNRDDNFEIYKVGTDGKNPVNLTNDPAGDFNPDWKPLKSGIRGKPFVVEGASSLRHRGVRRVRRAIEGVQERRHRTADQSTHVPRTRGLPWRDAQARRIGVASEEQGIGVRQANLKGRKT